jgi:acetyl-CoA carboxylase biotin carboxyl carrier protein
MNIDDIKQLVQMMVDNNLSELDITDGDSRVTLKRGAGGVVTAIPAGAIPMPATMAVPVASPAVPAAKEPAGEKLIEIRSPMVGTFYAAPSPDSEPYAKVGASVGDDTTVCIVEAMKVMNEIKAECSGTIAEICVKNAQPVEYNQVLFRVRPS